MKKINPKKEPLTVEKLRTFKGFEHCSDEEAENSLMAIKQLAAIIAEVTLQQEAKENSVKESSFSSSKLST